MTFPQDRLRRLRRTETIRRMVRETRLQTADFIYPLFVTGGVGVKEPIESMPGIYRFSVDNIFKEVEEACELGIFAFLLFSTPSYKDEKGTSAYDPDEVLQYAIKLLKEKYPEILLVTDVCICSYTNHGHCGLIKGKEILNDPTLDILAKVALTHVQAGADMIAPSDMMDGRVKVLRTSLDKKGYSHIPIMSYAVKYASAFYCPFREASHSSPQFGDRSSYQMDPANIREALRETQQDVLEGADIIMIKPALSYLDVIRTVRENINCPLAAYNVSGEYSMVKAAAANGWLDERKVVLEKLLAIKRAGADIICTYHAKDAARWINKEH